MKTGLMESQTTFCFLLYSKKFHFFYNSSLPISLSCYCVTHHTFIKYHLYYYQNGLESKDLAQLR